MSVSKKRKNIKHKHRKHGPIQVIKNSPVILIRKITIKYLPELDLFQVYLDMMMNAANLRMLGNIDPDRSYIEGIRVYNNNPQHWMTCNDVQLRKDHAPGIFSVLKAYVHTIGDLLDDGAEYKDLPEGQIYKHGKLFSDRECLELYQNVERAQNMKCAKCNSTNIGRTMKYIGTFIETQFGETLPGTLKAVPSGKWWRCLECNNQVAEIK